MSAAMWKIVIVSCLSIAASAVRIGDVSSGSGPGDDEEVKEDGGSKPKYANEQQRLAAQGMQQNENAEAEAAMQQQMMEGLGGPIQQQQMPSPLEGLGGPMQKEMPPPQMIAQQMPQPPPQLAHMLGVQCQANSIQELEAKFDPSLLTFLREGWEKGARERTKFNRAGRTIGAITVQENYGVDDDDLYGMYALGLPGQNNQMQGQGQGPVQPNIEKARHVFEQQMKKITMDPVVSGELLQHIVLQGQPWKNGYIYTKNNKWEDLKVGKQQSKTMQEDLDTGFFHFGNYRFHRLGKRSENAGNMNLDANSRVYVHAMPWDETHPQHAGLTIIDAIVSNYGDRFVDIQSCKTAGPLSRDRKDSIVCYCSTRQAANNLAEFISSHFADLLLPSLPPILRQVAPGVGVADEPKEIPGRSMSFGGFYSEVAQESLQEAYALEADAPTQVDMRSNEQRNEEALLRYLTIVCEKLVAKQVNPRHPADLRADTRAQESSEVFDAERTRVQRIHRNARKAIRN